jgi:signal transduction histidine kinase
MNKRYPSPGGLVAGIDLAAAGEETDHQLARLGRIERLGDGVGAVLPYAMLVVSNLMTAVVPESRSVLPVTLIVSAALAGWMLFLFTLHPAWRDRGPIMAVFLTGWLALTAVLVSIDGWFGFFSFTGYFLAFWAARGSWRAIAVIAVAVLTGTAQNGGVPGVAGHGPVVAWVVIVAINIAVGGGLNFFGTVSDRQSQRRRELMGDLSEANLKLEATLSENAGLQAQLVAQAREAGVADERQRMAREIHDTITQGLAGIITQLQAADQAVQSAEQRRHRDAALGLARDGLSEARRSVRALRPEPLQQAGRIEDALAVVAARWSELHGVQAAVTTTGPPRPIPAEAELVLLRTAQEALANVARHARARAVRLTLSYIGDQVTLDVRDDGSGFTPPAGAAPVSPAPAGAAPAAASPVPALAGSAPGGSAPGGPLRGGFGLTAMRERVEGLAGTLAIESEPGAGTTISASLPVPAPGGAQ